jgi:CHAD domain-containing protein
MPFDEKRIVKPARNMRKALKKWPKNPTPAPVHHLRTQIRRFEAVLQTLNLNETKLGRRLLHAVAPIRKAAGQVRDMDVLIDLAAKISTSDSNRERRIELLEELAAERLRCAKKMRNAVTLDRKQTMHRLRQMSKRLRASIRGSSAAGQTDKTGAAATAMSIAGSMAAWPRLNRNNLHAYRLKVKELRYALELALDPDKKLQKALGEAKNLIGAWHDWCELESFARKQFGNDDLVKQIHGAADQQFRQALKAATNLQKQYFGVREVPVRGQSPRTPHLTEPILMSAARMTA